MHSGYLPYPGPLRLFWRGVPRENEPVALMLTPGLEDPVAVNISGRVYDNPR